MFSFNLGCILGPPLSAWTASMWLGRHARPVGAAIGGLVFGFSPFVIGQSHAGHLMFTWLVLLPIIVMLVEDLMWRASRPLWPQAPLLGLVIAVQLLISSEALVITAIGCIGVAALLAATNVRAARRRLPILAPAIAVAGSVSLALSAWPLLEAFSSANAIRGPVQRLGLYGGRSAMLVGAPPTLLFHTGNGPSGHLSGSAPLRLLQDHLPVIGSVIPSRFAIVMWFAIAWLLAVSIDETRTRLPHRWRSLPVVVAAVCVLPLLPAPESATGKVVAALRFFRTSLRDLIPDGSIVMVVPMATVGDNAAELWQEAAGMRFRQLGGYARCASPDDSSKRPPDLIQGGVSIWALTGGAHPSRRRSTSSPLTVLHPVAPFPHAEGRRVSITQLRSLPVK